MINRIFVSILIFFIGIVGLFHAVTSSYAAGVFTATGSLNYGRSGHSATLLPNGKVLMVGGSTYVYTTELYDPASGTFSTTGSLIKSRSYGNTETLLPNGKVLIIGGINVDFHTTADAELYDPVSGIFLPTGNMIHARVGHTATLLSNGKVLIAGGDQDGVGGLSAAEIYDPLTGIFSQTGNMTYIHSGHTSTLLSSGKVLIAGGSSTKVMELYDPNTGIFSQTGNMVDFRTDHTANFLSNGKVLIVGGRNNYVAGGLKTAEIYDPFTGISTLISTLNQARYGQKAITISNGSVLILGGSNDFGGGQLKSAELYNLTTNTASQTGNMIYARNNHTATLLSNGKVLVVGGGLKGASNNTLVAELYNEYSSPTPTPTPSLCSNYGDVNLDGEITIVDATLVLKYIVGSTTFTAEQKKRADVSGDGTIDVRDSILVQQYIVGKITAFPACNIPSLAQTPVNFFSTAQSTGAGGYTCFRGCSSTTTTIKYNDTTHVQEGSGSARIKIASNTTGNRGFIALVDRNLTSGIPVRARFYIWALSGKSFTVAIRARSSNGNNIDASKTTIKGNNDWQLVNLSWTTSTDVTQIGVETFRASPTETYFWVDNLYISTQ